jgi:epoxyqueuosine reductase
LRRRLTALADALAATLGGAVSARPCVDSAPILERDLAERAGLGFSAKNTMLIAPGLGSYTVLGELLLDVDAAPTAPFAVAAPRCGECTACLTACPTGAFLGPHVLDARRCISYLTIEYRGVVARELRPKMGVMIFGCDVCQEVCPYNAAAPDRVASDPELAPRPDLATTDLLALLTLGARALRRRIQGTALVRAHRDQLLRNVCIACGNAGDTRAVPSLRQALVGERALVRGHAAWALGCLGDRASLADALAHERDPYVRSEIVTALAELDAASVRDSSPPSPAPS